MESNTSNLCVALYDRYFCLLLGLYQQHTRAYSHTQAKKHTIEAHKSHRIYYNIINTKIMIRSIIFIVHKTLKIETKEIIFVYFKCPSNFLNETNFIDEKVCMSQRNKCYYLL